MAPTRTRKRKSDVSSSSADHRSPIKKRKMALTLAQKQALIDNLQLELTERARRLRAQYHVQAQQLRSRVEMRVNRIPRALRRLKMGDLLAKHAETQQPRPPRSPYVAKPPPVPAKDGVPLKPIPRKPVTAAGSQRGHKRLSDAITDADDKENSVEPMGNPKKKLHTAAESVRLQPGQILSPASTNARVVPRGQERPASPSKSVISRPTSPIKVPGSKSSNLLSSMVEKAKASRGTAATARKGAAPTPASGTTSTRGRKPVNPSASVSSTSTTATTRGRRKVSQASESSEASTGTVIKKTTGSKAAAASKPTPATKRTVMGTIKSATTKRAPAAPKVASGTATTGRTLRKRGV